jgi:hypothetical protein
MWVFMISQEHAERLAHEWVEAWNRHDLDGIMAYYAAEIVFTSPFVPILANEPTATLRGTTAVHANFAKGLATYPELLFKLLDALAGVRSVTLYDRSVNDKLAAETMCLDAESLIARVECYYRDGGRRAITRNGAAHVA